MKKKLKGKFVKLLILLSLTRWYNILLTAIAQYLAAFFVFNNRSTFWQTLQDVNLHLIVLCTSLFLAAGYIINFFYDKEVDLINYPKRTQLFLRLNKEFLLRTYFITIVIGLILAFFASFKIGIFFFVFGFLLWFYSHKLKRIPFLREVTATLLTITSFFSITFHYGWINADMFFYGWFMFFIILIREGFKDIEKIKGNAVYSYYSNALVNNSKLFLLFLRACCLVAFLPIVFFAMLKGLNHITLWTMIINLIVLIGSVFLLHRKLNKTYAGLGNNLLKFAIVLSLFGLIWL
jgi:4-hydroxybenzoate polyprenyltransferase